MYDFFTTKQNPSIDVWYIFGKKSGEDDYIYSFFNKKISCNFIDIENSDIDDFELLMDIDAQKNDIDKLKEYLKAKKITKIKLISSYKKLYEKIKNFSPLNNNLLDMNRFLFDFEFNENPWNEFNNDTFNKAILIGIIYAE